ncbi:NAD dependent epimerase/dehydratase family protein-like protein [Fusarium oxysporum Fo47]|uniref:PRISE-like Rossmann-fold domain-containing protein n=1 Tax=Fusarium oxysporum Fo47 TaxID=660027 RepID=W9J9M0_FUSOX|nr:NAD dependent epimerase/dehydratase family protein-like protein [Fusarium oxysporum Fo47]EWZ28566.1 hypothetical protein FOZG_17775 [Fusarium oxysporum Fo47]QKD56780.1 NAD dependent epimerase/dehydratase family protein-like protein [Fusarium oxysporum Fo47]
MSAQTVHSNHIFHGLPQFPDHVQGLTAIITGANGISGQYMLKVLTQSPKRWARIYCLSRRPPVVEGKLPDFVKHIPLDFLDEPDVIAKTLLDKSVKADYIFFFSYIQVKAEPGASIWANAEGLLRVNTLLLSNFLESLSLASIKPRRIMLQTGAKNYGLHLGPCVAPQEESDARVLLEPNFYYSQEDLLWAYCKKHDIGWNVVRPAWILGAVPDAAMNLCFPLGVYAIVCKHLGQALDFPAGLESWESIHMQSSAMLNAYLEEWCVLTEAAENEAFNASDGSPFTWGKFWPELASWYGIDSNAPDTDATYHEYDTAHNPPPRGFGPVAKVRVKFSFVEWAKQPEVQQAWKELGLKHGLVNSQLDDTDRIFGTADLAVRTPYSSYLSMLKARKLGWHGFVDTTESILDVLRGFEQLKMLPPLLAEGGNGKN